MSYIGCLISLCPFSLNKRQLNIDCTNCSFSFSYRERLKQRMKSCWKRSYHWTLRTCQLLRKILTCLVMVKRNLNFPFIIPSLAVLTTCIDEIISVIKFFSSYPKFKEFQCNYLLNKKSNNLFYFKFKRFYDFY